LKAPGQSPPTVRLKAPWLKKIVLQNLDVRSIDIALQ
jgi:hypothetical protein